MMEDIIVDDKDLVRLDLYVSNILTDYSRSYLGKKILEGKIRVNEKKVKASYKLECGDRISIDNIDDIFILEPREMKLEIVYEDEDILIVNKPSGIVVHPGKDNDNNTLVNGLIAYTDRLSTLDGEYRPGIVHRLDKDTEGLLIIARDNKVHEFLKEQIMNRSMVRKYLLLVDGSIEEDQFSVDRPIGRDPKNRLRMKVIDQNSKEALTHFTVVERFSDYTLLEASLYTGRMHQIRVHMKSIGHPVVGDSLYGSRKNRFGLNSQLLIAYKLGFIHPHTKKYMEVENKKLEALDKILNILRKEG